MFLDDLVQYVEDNTSLEYNQLFTSFILPADRNLIVGIGHLPGGHTNYQIGTTVIGSKRLEFVINVRGNDNDIITRTLVYEIHNILDGLHAQTIGTTNIIFCQARQPQLIGIDDNKNYEYSFSISLDIED